MKIGTAVGVREKENNQLLPMKESQQLQYTVMKMKMMNQSLKVLEMWAQKVYCPPQKKPKHTQQKRKKVTKETTCKVKNPQTSIKYKKEKRKGNLQLMQWLREMKQLFFFGSKNCRQKKLDRRRQREKDAINAWLMADQNRKHRTCVCNSTTRTHANLVTAKITTTVSEDGM